MHIFELCQIQTVHAFQGKTLKPELTCFTFMLGRNVQLVPRLRSIWCRFVYGLGMKVGLTTEWILIVKKRFCSRFVTFITIIHNILFFTIF